MYDSLVSLPSYSRANDPYPGSFDSSYTFSSPVASLSLSPGRFSIFVFTIRFEIKHCRTSLNSLSFPFIFVVRSVHSDSPFSLFLSSYEVTDLGSSAALSSDQAPLCPLAQRITTNNEERKNLSFTTHDMLLLAWLLPSQSPLTSLFLFFASLSLSPIRVPFTQREWRNGKGVATIDRYARFTLSHQQI